VLEGKKCSSVHKEGKTRVIRLFNEAKKKGNGKEKGAPPSMESRRVPILGGEGLVWRGTGEDGEKAERSNTMEKKGHRKRDFPPSKKGFENYLGKKKTVTPTWEGT